MLGSKTPHLSPPPSANTLCKPKKKWGIHHWQTILRAEAVPVNLPQMKVEAFGCHRFPILQEMGKADDTPFPMRWHGLWLMPNP